MPLFESSSAGFVHVLPIGTMYLSGSRLPRPMRPAHFILPGGLQKLAALTKALTS